MILDFFGSAAFGTLAGYAFSFLTRREERIAQREKFEHERGMIELSMKAEAAKAAAALEMAQETAAGEAFKENIEQSSLQMLARSGIKAVDAVFTGLIVAMRPALTVYFMWLMTRITLQLSARVGGVEGLSNEDAVRLYTQVIDGIFIMGSSAAGFWFGIRGTSSRGKK